MAESLSRVEQPTPGQRAIEAARHLRQTQGALWSRWNFHGPGAKKFYKDGTPHSVEEQARRLEENLDAEKALDDALAALGSVGVGDEPPQASERVVEAARRVVNERTHVTGSTDGSVAVEVEASYWDALVAAVGDGR